MGDASAAIGGKTSAMRFARASLWGWWREEWQFSTAALVAFGDDYALIEMPLAPDVLEAPNCCSSRAVGVFSADAKPATSANPSAAINPGCYTSGSHAGKTQIVRSVAT